MHVGGASFGEAIGKADSAGMGQGFLGGTVRLLPGGGDAEQGMVRDQLDKGGGSLLDPEQELAHQSYTCPLEIVEPYV